jgi:hypothetical protein
LDRVFGSDTADAAMAKAKAIGVPNAVAVHSPDSPKRAYPAKQEADIFITTKPRKARTR